MTHNITRIFFFLFLLIVSKSEILKGQDSSKVAIKNSIFVTADYVVGGLGNLGGSINYEISLFKSRAFLGAGFALYQREVKAISVELNYLCFKKKHHLEAGLAYRHIFNPQNTGELYSINLGYKYANLSKRSMNFKIGISPGIAQQKRIVRNVEKNEYYFLPRIYIGLGYSF